MTWQGNESIRDEFRGVAHYDTHEQHEIASLKYQLEQQRRETAHFKVAAQDLERSLQSVTETNKRNFDALQELTKATHGLVPEFQRQGNFTICQLIDPLSERVFVGAACCGLDDKYNEDIGKAISFGRAANARADFYAEEAFSR